MMNWRLRPSSIVGYIRFMPLVAMTTTWVQAAWKWKLWKIALYYATEKQMNMFIFRGSALNTSKIHSTLHASSYFLDTPHGSLKHYLPLRHYQLMIHLRVHVDDITSVIKCFCAKPPANPPSRSFPWSTTDCTITGHVLRNSCHSVDSQRCPSQRPADPEFSPSAAVLLDVRAHITSTVWCGRYRHWLTAACEHVQSHMGKDWLPHAGTRQNH